jgi:hypothetical protein
MTDPKHPLNETEKRVFGADAKRHPVTGQVLEQGSGAHPPEIQAELFCQNLERTEGPAAATRHDCQNTRRT